VVVMDERMDRRIARLALDRFRVSGFVGTSIADLAGALGVSKAAIYYHYRSKDTLLHRLVDPLLDAIDACIQDHTTTVASAQTAQRLLGAYLAVLLTHSDVAPLIATDVAVLNHPRIGPRLRAQNHQLQSLLTAPDTSPPARLHAEAALGAIWRPLIPNPPSTSPIPPTSASWSTPPSPPSNPTTLSLMGGPVRLPNRPAPPVPATNDADSTSGVVNR
jgi:AcrR family transcriptional regulator